MIDRLHSLGMWADLTDPASGFPVGLIMTPSHLSSFSHAPFTFYSLEAPLVHHPIPMFKQPMP